MPVFFLRIPLDFSKLIYLLYFILKTVTKKKEKKIAMNGINRQLVFNV